MNPSHLVLIAVFDGLRGDLVRPDWTPNLWRLRGEGVWFERSHCVFPAVTRVNASSLSTGSFPIRHGIGGNTIWRPDVDAARPLRTNDTADLLRLESTRGRLLGVPTLGEVLAEHGLGMVAVGTGSAGSAHLLHPCAGVCGGAVLHYEFSVPADLNAQVEGRIGPWPAEGSEPYPGLAVSRVRHGFRALTEVLAPERRPAVAAFWCTVPDGSHHRYGLGDPRSVESLRAADAAFAEAIQSLQSLYEAVDIIVTADHGYVTVTEHVDPAEELRRAGLLPPAKWGEVVLCIDGGSVAIHLGDAIEREPIVRFLLGQAWAGSVFSPGGRVPGTLPLEATGCGGADAPDLLLCLGWNDAENTHGCPGGGWGAGGIAVGAGDHGGLSPWEMRNSLLIAGPSFREGEVSEIPAGIVDIAPTVLQLLGLEAPAEWQGRVLREALRGGGAGPRGGEESVVVDADVGGAAVRQRLVLDAAGDVHYPSAASKAAS